MMFPHPLIPTVLEPCLEPECHTIIHWTQGRIRLRTPRLAKEPDYATRLERSLQTYPFVTGVSCNAAADSVTVHYAANQVTATRFREHLVRALQQAAVPLSLSCPTKALAQRLGVPFQTLNWRRSQANFWEWSRTQDPQGIAWSYDPETKCFQSCTMAPAKPAPADSEPSKVDQIFQSLMGATGGRLGGLLGKLAGEAIGLALWGTAGVMVGAEIGMMIGEIVGEELGSV
jgi:hypothetical protein